MLKIDKPENKRLFRAAPELLEACKYAFKNLSPNGGIQKDFSGHNAKAMLSKAIHNATKGGQDGK